MVVFLLLLIVAILLFGSSKVLGAIGAVLGFIVLFVGLCFGVVALASMATAAGTTLDDIFVPLVLGVTGFLCVTGLVLWLLADWLRGRAEASAVAAVDQQRRLAAIRTSEEEAKRSAPALRPDDRWLD